MKRINQIFSSTEAIAAVIEKAKETKERYKVSTVKAFEDSLLSCYKYSKAWYKRHKGETEEYYTFDSYKKYFYAFIIGNLPELPKAIRHYLTAFYRSSNYTIYPDAVVIEEIKNHIIELEKENQAIKQLRQETAELRLMLSHQNCKLALEKVLPLHKLERAGEFFGNGRCDELMFCICMFNYGYILGKRTERKKHH